MCHHFPIDLAGVDIAMEDDEHLEKYEEGFKGRLAGRVHKVIPRKVFMLQPLLQM